MELKGGENMNQLITLVVNLIFLGILGYVVLLFVNWLPLPEPFKQIVKILLGVIALAILLQILGIYNFGVNWKFNQF